MGTAGKMQAPLATSSVVVCSPIDLALGHGGPRCSGQEHTAYPTCLQEKCPTRNFRRQMMPPSCHHCLRSLSTCARACGLWSGARGHYCLDPVRHRRTTHRPTSRGLSVPKSVGHLQGCRRSPRLRCLHLPLSPGRRHRRRRRSARPSARRMHCQTR